LDVKRLIEALWSAAEQRLDQTMACIGGPSRSNKKTFKPSERNEHGP